MRLAVSPISFIFQFTPLCERLRLYHFPCGSLQIISIHASLREATVVSLYLVSVVSISIHASLREATDRSYTFQPGTGYFNSRLSARGYCHTHSSFNSYFYFNSRLSARGYLMQRYRSKNFVISIHASLREATLPADLLQRCSAISIHASLREATEPAGSWYPLPAYFNSRLSARGYVVTHIPRLTHTFISIHASLREATADLICVFRFFSFQFTPLCERLRLLAAFWLVRVDFNSRLSARGY